MNKNIIIFLFIFLLTLQVAEAINLTNGLKHYWSFDENTGTTAVDKMQSQNATLRYNTLWSSSGKINASYNGTATTTWANVARVPDTLGDNYTISLWFNGNLAHDSSSPRVPGLFFREASSSGQFGLWLDGAGWWEPGAVCFFSAGTTHRLCSTTTSWNANTWYYVTITQEGSTGIIYINGAYQKNLTTMPSVAVSTTNTYIGSRHGQNNDRGFEGRIDEVGVWSRALNITEISALYNSGDGFAYPFEIPLPPTNDTNITLTAKNNITNGALTNFSINFSVGGVDYSFNTTNGTINTEILLNLSLLYNLSFDSMENGGYYTSSYQNLNLSLGTYEGALNPFFYLYSVTYSNFSLISGNNYTRLLSYEYVYTCPDHIPTYRAVYINGSLNTNTSLSCNNVTSSIVRTYAHPIEGAYNITLGMIAPGYEQNTTQRTFISDLYPPVISIFNVSTNEGFNTAGYNITLRCYDNIAPSLFYNLTRNSVLIYNASLSNNTLSTRTLSNLDGTHSNIFKCSDNFTTTTSLLSNTYYFKQMSIINEKTGNLFLINNMTNARVIFESPAYNTTINLKTLNTSVFNITSNNTAGRNFRLELEYETGEVVTRDLNTRYVENVSTICANTNPTTHIEQYIISATLKPAIIRSNVHNCYVLADLTRFAYQSNFMAKYYTIPTYYFLNTISNQGEESLIASVEGGTGSTINLDTLSFGSTIFNVNLRNPSVMIQKHPTSNNTLIIFYYNPKADNNALDIQIYYNNTEYFSTTTTTSPNNITINFDYTTLPVSEDATFRIVFTATTTEGAENIITTYYSLSGSSGSFSVALGLTLGIIMFVSLMTIVSPSFAFGYFGIIATLSGIFILALSPSVWYSNLFIGVFIIIGIYQFLHFTQTNRTPGGMV
jgi:hypothetical protein